MAGAVFLLWLIGVSDQPLGVPSLGGTVRDTNGGVLPGATVSLLDSAARILGSATTGPDGGFRLRVPRTGDYRLRVTLPGFERREQAVSIRDTNALSPIEVMLGLAH